VRYEPNDSLGNAFGPLANGASIEAALCEGDPDDFYFIVLETSATLQIDLTDLPANTDYDPRYPTRANRGADRRNLPKSAI
jgi:hypothetical protein